MKKKLLLSFLAMIVMVFVMRYQGQSLVTDQTPRGIIDLEFARTPERLQQLQTVWQWSDVRLNIFLDFIFIVAYVWFFAVCAINIKNKNNWTGAGQAFVLLAFAAGVLDVMENMLMYTAFTNHLSTGGLNYIFYCAATKFILIAFLIFYFIISLPFMRKAKK